MGLLGARCVALEILESVKRILDFRVVKPPPIYGSLPIIAPKYERLVS
jgi:hypothetical protein